MGVCAVDRDAPGDIQCVPVRGMRKMRAALSAGHSDPRDAKRSGKRTGDADISGDQVGGEDIPDLLSRKKCYTEVESGGLRTSALNGSVKRKNRVAQSLMIRAARKLYKIVLKICEKRC